LIRRECEKSAALRMGERKGEETAIFAKRKHV